MRPMTLVKDRSFQNSLEISYPLSLSLSFIFVFWFKNISLERSFCENDPFLSLPLQNKYWHREPPLHHFCLSIIIRVLLFLRTWEFLHRTISSFRERKNQHMLYRNEGNRVDNLRPQSQTYSFHSSTVTYGGANGAYYTSSTTRRMGGDGVVMEESKEAHTTTGRATHRISKGIHNKGHSVTRKLNPDGNVDTVQMLHNLNEDQLAGFEETWMESARKHLPGGWNQGLNSFNNGHAGSSAGGTNGQVQRGWALPSTESLQNQGRMRSQMN